jgi:hypothetical protein
VTRPSERIGYQEWVAGGIAVGLIVVGILSIVLIVGRRGGREARGSVTGDVRCGPVQSLPSEGVEHLPEGVSPPAYATRPAASGIHTDATLPADIHVYEEPVPEETALHNLEHAYVLIHYRADGAGALTPGVVAALADLAQDQDKVIMAPYPALNAGVNLALVAWQRLQECAVRDDPGAAVEVTRAFIAQFRGGGVAPEPSGA